MKRHTSKPPHLLACNIAPSPPAMFWGGLVQVQADTSLGLRQSFTMVSAGRISTLWNRAKLVLVYQRDLTTSPHLGSDAEDNGGRATLRLRECYVEITEPVRRYPQSRGGSGDPSLRGAVFETVRIPVDPAGEQTIGDADSFLPLRPQPGTMDGPFEVYLLLAGDNGEVRARLPAPEALFFYTNLRDDASPNTDEWPPVSGVDLPDLLPSMLSTLPRT